MQEWLEEEWMSWKVVDVVGNKSCPTSSLCPPLSSQMDVPSPHPSSSQLSSAQMGSPQQYPPTFILLVSGGGLSLSQLEQQRNNDKMLPNLR